jgi:hypothetical protein
VVLPEEEGEIDLSGLSDSISLNVDAGSNDSDPEDTEMALPAAEELTGIEIEFDLGDAPVPTTEAAPVAGTSPDDSLKLDVRDKGVSFSAEAPPANPDGVTVFDAEEAGPGTVPAPTPDLDVDTSLEDLEETEDTAEVLRASSVSSDHSDPGSQRQRPLSFPHVVAGLHHHHQ